jgi:hypothetical protein
MVVAPVRAAEWREVDGRVVLERPQPRRSWLRAPLERLSRVLTAPRINLDDRGSFVWKRLDGSRTMAELAGELRDRFGESVEPAEERLGELVRQLRRERLVAYPGWDREAPVSG